MYQETVDLAADLATKKATFLRRNPLGYFLASVLAGAYVGLGIVLIFSIGAPLAAASSPAVPALMGASFGIALSLVIFAGSELFTGNNLIMTCGVWLGSVSFRQLALVWVVSWVGNLVGSMALAALVHASGAAVTVKGAAFVTAVATAKMGAPAISLILRAVLCNWLVCLAVWTSMRTKSDAAKLILIFWCLFAFIGSGFEHSVANMTLLTLALFHPAAGIGWGGWIRNLGLVTLGNMIGGAVLVGMAYCHASARQTREPAVASSVTEIPRITVVGKGT